MAAFEFETEVDGLPGYDVEVIGFFPDCEDRKKRVVVRTQTDADGDHFEEPRISNKPLSNMTHWSNLPDDPAVVP